MSKMGDLIVRMKLQYDDYKKGLKKATADTNSFAGTLGKIKGVGLAVWGAIGASVVGFAKSFINHSQMMADKWAVGVGSMKSAWDQFLTSLTNWDWEGFGNRIKNAMSATAKSIAAHDAEFEVENSIKLRQAQQAERLAQLQIEMRDMRKSNAERVKAAQEYLDAVTPIYKAEQELRRKIYLADTGEYLNKAGLSDTTANRDLLRTFLTSIAPDSDLVRILQEYTKKSSGKKYKLSQNDLAKLDSIFGSYGIRETAVFGVLANNYQGTNDEAAKKVVEAIANYDRSIAAFAEETRKVQTLQNSAMAIIEKTTGGDASFTPYAGIAKEAAKEVKFEPFKIEFDDELDWDELDADIADFADRWNEECLRIKELNDMLEMSFVTALSGGMQAVTDALMGIEGAGAEQVLAALIQPFGQTAIQLGEMLLAQGIAVNAFKSSLESLQGGPAIAAGLALIAVGSAISSGIKSLAGGSGTTASAASSSTGTETYAQEITVNVVGEISGDKIILAGQKTLNKWSR